MKKKYKADRNETKDLNRQKDRYSEFFICRLYKDKVKTLCNKKI